MQLINRTQVRANLMLHVLLPQAKELQGGPVWITELAHGKPETDESLVTQVVCLPFCVSRTTLPALQLLMLELTSPGCRGAWCKSYASQRGRTSASYSDVRDGEILSTPVSEQLELDVRGAPLTGITNISLQVCH